MYPEENSGRLLEEDLDRLYGVEEQSTEGKEEEEETCSGSDSP